MKCFLSLRLITFNYLSTLCDKRFAFELFAGTEPTLLV